MSDDRTSSQRSWLEKLGDLFSDDPQNRHDLKLLLREAAVRNVVDGETLAIMEKALQVSEMKVRDVMVPRSQMSAIKLSDSLEQNINIIIECAHSRFPVFSENGNDVEGILLAKDLLPLILSQKIDAFSIKDHSREPTFVPESKRLNVLLREFRTTRQHMAVVVDEFGEVAGLVTIEDVLEQIVGDIEDEHDEDGNDSIRQVSDDIAMVKALTPVEDFNEHFNARIDDDEFDTIGGIVTHHFGRVPECGEHIDIEQWRFKVVHGNSRSIQLLQVSSVDD